MFGGLRKSEGVISDTVRGKQQPLCLTHSRAFLSAFSYHKALTATQIQISLKKFTFGAIISHFMPYYEWFRNSFGREPSPLKEVIPVVCVCIPGCMCACLHQPCSTLWPY